MNARAGARSAGIAIRFRTGVNTGEVVAGDPETGTTLVTGDTGQHRGPAGAGGAPGRDPAGQAHVLAWSATRSTRSPSSPIAAKGKAEPVEAYRLVAVRAGAAGRARHLDAPDGGRDEELATPRPTPGARGRRAHPAPRHPRRPGGCRQEPTGPRVHRARPRRRRPGPRRPLPVLRRGHHLLARARARAPGRRASPRRTTRRRREDRAGGHRSAIPQVRSPRRVGHRAVIGVRRRRRSCSGRSAASSSISPPISRRSSCSRTSTGPRTRSSTSWTTSSTSPRGSRCSCSRRRARSSSERRPAVARRRARSATVHPPRAARPDERDRTSSTALPGGSADPCTMLARGSSTPPKATRCTSRSSGPPARRRHDPRDRRPGWEAADGHRRRSASRPPSGRCLAARLEALPATERGRRAAGVGDRPQLRGGGARGGRSGGRRGLTRHLLALVRKELLRPDRAGADRGRRVPLPPRR